MTDLSALCVLKIARREVIRNDLYRLPAEECTGVLLLAVEQNSAIRLETFSKLCWRDTVRAASGQHGACWGRHLPSHQRYTN